MACARFRDLVGAAGEGVQFPLLFPPGTGDGELRRFAADFEAELGHSADFTATLTYDATRLLIECIRQAGPNRLRIRDALSRTAAWPGLSGPIQFDGTGQNRRTDVGMGTIQKGTIVPVHRAGP
ncbi:MAG: ABC transporter substrate-binding protein [Verrucomicrobiota bacterium]